MKKALLLLFFLFSFLFSHSQNDFLDLENQIDIKIKQKKFDDAMVIIETFENNNDLTDSLYLELVDLKINIFELANKREETLKSLIIAVEKLPESNYLKNSLATFFLLSSMSEQAEPLVYENIKRCKNLDDSLFAYSNYSTLMDVSKKYDSVIILSDLLFSFDSIEGAKFKLNKALALFSLKRVQEAIQFMNEYISSYGGDRDWFALNNLGLMYQETNEHEKSIPYLKRAIELNNDCAFCYSNLGFSFHLQGNYDEAIKNYNISISLNSHNSWVYKNKAKTYLALNMNKEACKYLNEAKDKSYEYYYGEEVNELLKKYCID